VNIKDLIAIDVHTHAEVSCRQPQDEVWKEYEDAASLYFKAGKRPTIAETVAYYRERKIGFVMFTVDCEAEIGSRRISNEEVSDAARDNGDVMIAFASIDPHRARWACGKRAGSSGITASRDSSSTRRCRVSFPTTAWRIRSTK